MAENVTIKIDGMSCNMCSVSIEEDLENMQGVIKATVSYPKGKAIVEYDSGSIELSDLKKTIHKLGFTVVE